MAQPRVTKISSGEFTESPNSKVFQAAETGEDFLIEANDSQLTLPDDTVIEANQELVINSADYPGGLQGINVVPMASNYWQDRTINFFGDSFTADDLFPTAVSTALGLSSVIRTGVAGSTVVPGASPDPSTPSGVARIDASLAANISEAIFILIGTNDWAASAVLGTINDADTYTVVNGVVTAMPAENTFYAGLKYILRKATAARPGRVFISTMMVRTNQSSNQAGQLNYVNAVKAVGALLGVPVYDMFNDSGVTYDNIGTYSTDNVHPDTVAGKALISGVVQAFLEEQGEVLSLQTKLNKSVLTVTATTSDSASLSFTTVVNAQKYSVQRSSLENDFSGGVEIAVITGTTLTDVNLSSSTNYYYRVVPLALGYKPGDASDVKIATTAAGGGLQPIIGYVDRNSNLEINGNNIAYNAGGDFGMATHTPALPVGWAGIIRMDGPITNSSALFGLNQNIDGSGPNGFTAAIKYNRIDNSTFVINGIALGDGLNNFTNLTREGSIIPKLQVRLTGTRMYVEYSLNGVDYVEIVDSSPNPIAQPQVLLYIVGYFETTGLTLNNLVSTPLT